jgi:hypothetical protein
VSAALSGELDSAVTRQWQVDLDSFGTARLLPLPGGGLIAALGDNLTAISPAGAALWNERIDNRPAAWAMGGETLLLASSGSDSRLWTLSASGASPWEAAGGQPLLLGEQPWLYAADGIYRLDEERQQAALTLPLAQALVQIGDAISLAGGGGLVAHSDRDDQRLLRLDDNGELLWERSFRRSLTGRPRLLESEGRVYLIDDGTTRSAGLITLYEVDLLSGNLTRIFVGGTRTPARNETWLLAGSDGRLFLNIGGGHLLALDLAAARGGVAAQ